VNERYFAGKKVLVMGLGRFGGGTDAARFAHGAGGRVTVTDLAGPDKLRDSIRLLDDCRGIEFHLGGHDAGDFESADIVIVNPAVDPRNEFVRLAAALGKLVTTAMNIFFELCFARAQRPVVIGITGANGKSTTAALTAHLLRLARPETAGGEVLLSGNIGDAALLCSAGRLGRRDLAVLEISSFQAEWLDRIQKAPDISVLTNLTANHLDRHGTFEAYCRAKENVFLLQRLDAERPAVSVFNLDDRVGSLWYEKYRTDGGRVCIGFSAADVGAGPRKAFGLPGAANLSNLAAALAVAGRLGADEGRIAACLGCFESLPHRLQLVADIDGVKWYDDSIATTPDSAIAALEAFDAPKIIIAGGYDKNLSFEALGREIARRAKAAVLIGATARKIAEAVRACPGSSASVRLAASLADAVGIARRLAASGDVVMLSPACASYDMFENFRQRGLKFADLVRSLDAGGARLKSRRESADWPV
jgi:UDP-N-acetylmuramoylalanine--D-glutamate ligase